MKQIFSTRLRRADHLGAYEDPLEDSSIDAVGPASARRGLSVTHLGKFYHPSHGGIERAVRTLAQSQARLGCRVRVVCLDHERGRRTRVDRDGPVEVLRVGRSLSLMKLDLCPDLPRILRETEGEIVHLHTPNPTMISGLLLSGDRRPLVISHHSDIIRQRVRAILFSALERSCYRRARLILAMSPPYVDGSKVLRKHRDRLDVLPIGLELASFLDPPGDVRRKSEQIRRAYPGPLWFACGRLVYYKGMQVALQALKHVPGTLLIAGDGPARSNLERLAARLGIEKRVVFLGRVPRDEDLYAHYLAAEAFWFPSNARSEAYGLVQVEAMASGCPVINTDIPHSGVSWVSRHEESGLTVPVDDPEAFASAALRILNEPGLRSRLSAGAWARAVSTFHSDWTGSRSVDLYAKILTGQSAAPASV